MTETEVRTWLNRGYKLDIEINALLEEQRKAFNRATGTADERGEKVQTSKTNTTELKFIDYASYSELIDRRIDELYTVKREILSAINKVEDNGQRVLLIMRYVKFEKWERIAETMNYANQWVYVLHKRAIKSLTKILNS